MADIETTAKADASAIAAKEITFFTAHPKAIAIGAGIAGVIVGFALHFFL